MEVPIPSAAWAKQPCPTPKAQFSCTERVTLGTVCGDQLQAQIFTVSLLTSMFLFTPSIFRGDLTQE